MIAIGDIIQIRQFMSVPYSAISQADIDKMQKESREAEMAAAGLNGGLASTTSSSNQSAKLKSASTLPGSAVKDLKGKG